MDARCEYYDMLMYTWEDSQVWIRDWIVITSLLQSSSGMSGVEEKAIRVDWLFPKGAPKEAEGSLVLPNHVHPEEEDQHAIISSLLPLNASPRVTSIKIKKTFLFVFCPSSIINFHPSLMRFNFSNVANNLRDFIKILHGEKKQQYKV